MSIAQRATRSVLWMFAESWLGLAWGAFSLAILANILGPEVFGTLAIAHMVLGVGGIFLGSALTAALRQFEELKPGHSNAAFWISMGMCAAFTLIVVLIAEPLALAFDMPILAQLVPVIALTSLIGQLAEVPEALLERELEHKKLVILDNVIGLPCSVLGIVLAVMGFGVWSLVWSGVLTTVAATVAVFWVTKWSPSFAMSREDVKDILTFGRDTVFLRVLGFFDDFLPKLFVGYMLGERALGLYSMALNLSGQLSGLLMGPLSAIAMEVVARLQRDLSQLRTLLREVFSLTTFVMYPAILGACFVAPFATLMIFGEQWRGIEVPLVIALLIGLRHATGDFNVAILRGLGETKAPLLSLGVGVIVFLLALPIGVQFGLIGVMAVVALRVFATWPLSAWFVERRSGFPLIEQFTIGWRPLICALAMSMCLFGLMQQPFFITLPNAGKISLLIGVGIAVYSLLFAMFWRRRLLDGLSQFRRALRLQDAEDGVPVAALEQAPA